MTTGERVLGDGSMKQSPQTIGLVVVGDSWDVPQAMQIVRGEIEAADCLLACVKKLKQHGSIRSASMAYGMEIALIRTLGLATERILKTMIALDGKEPPRTHNLVKLGKEVLPVLMHEAARRMKGFNDVVFAADKTYTEFGYLCDTRSREENPTFPSLDKWLEATVVLARVCAWRIEQMGAKVDKDYLLVASEDKVNIRQFEAMPGETS